MAISENDVGLPPDQAMRAFGPPELVAEMRALEAEGYLPFAGRVGPGNLPLVAALSYRGSDPAKQNRASDLCDQLRDNLRKEIAGGRLILSGIINNMASGEPSALDPAIGRRDVPAEMARIYHLDLHEHDMVFARIDLRGDPLTSVEGPAVAWRLLLARIRPAAGDGIRLANRLGGKAMIGIPTDRYREAVEWVRGIVDASPDFPTRKLSDLETEGREKFTLGRDAMAQAVNEGCPRSTRPAWRKRGPKKQKV